MRRRFLLCLSLIIIFMCLTASVFAQEEPKKMYTAITTGDTATVKALLDGGYNPNMLLPNWQPPVMEAAQAGNADMVELLIKAGADVNLNANNNFGGNALTGAVWSTRDTHNPVNTIKIIKLLVEAGIDINSGEVRNESGDYKADGKKWESYINPVWYAIGGYDCSADILEFMLQKGCTPSWSYVINEADEKRHDSTLDDTINAVKKSKTNKNDKKEYNRILKILKDAEKKPAAKPETKAEAPAPATAPSVAAPAAAAQPAAKPAAKPASKPAVKKPTPAPKAAPVEAAPSQSASAILSKAEATELLRKSVADGNKENFYRSLVMGADINAVDSENKTALIEAVMHQKHEMAEVLIYKGADVNVMTTGGNTALSLAKDLRADNIVKLLQSAGATK